MPFDGTNFSPRPPRRGSPRPPSDNAVSIIILAVALSLLVMPISLTALVDIVRYIRSS